MQPIFYGTQNPLLRSLIILTISLLGFLFVGPSVATLICSTFYKGDLLTVLSELPITDRAVWLPLMIFQACSAGIGLILIPLLYLKFMEKKSLNIFCVKICVKKSWPLLLLTFIIAILFLFPLSAVIDWNENIHFPEWMSDFGHWAAQAEERARMLTLFLTHFETPTDFLLGLLIIAVFPAIGEELLFRGFIQNYLWKSFNNHHLAIWMAATLFSAIHFQFFGFFPRLFLGVLFGYLYWWSGTLWIPVAAHFINNALNVLLLYLHQLNLTDFDVDSNLHLPVYVVAISLAALAFLLFQFKKLAP